MKKFVVLLLSLLLVFSMAVSAAADIAWVPYLDDYFDNHPTTSVKATYYVPESMTVTVYESPVNGTVLFTLEEGEEVYVGYCAEENGELWGLANFFTEGKNTSGWFRLGRLQRAMDRNAFMDLYLEEFTVDEDFFIHADDIKTELREWTYPGSGIYDGFISPSMLRDTSNSKYRDNKLYFEYLYTDPYGGLWGYSGFIGGPAGWIYLDDPENPEPVIFPLEYPNTVTDTSPTETPPETPWSIDLVLIIGLVAAVVVITGISIVIVKKKK